MKKVGLLALFAVVISGCGGGSEESTAPASDANSTPPVAAPSPAPVPAPPPPSGSGAAFDSRPAFDVVSVETNVNTLLGVGDIDGDGRPDLVAVINGATSFDEPKTYVYLQGAGGAFTKTDWKTGTQYPIGMADFNKDGHADLIAANYDGSCSWTPYYGDATGTLSPGAPMQYGTCNLPRFWIGDFDGNGWLDVIPLDHAAAVNALGSASGFSPSPQQKPFALQGQTAAIADFDGDGVQDLAAISPEFASGQWAVSIAYGAGAGNYGQIKNWVEPQLTGAWGSDVLAIAADINNDGLPDIIYSAGSMDAMVLLNSPSGFNSPPSVVPLGSVAAMALADVNGDGNLDVIASSSAGVEIVLGDGNAKWAAPEVIPGTANASQLQVVPSAVPGHPDLVFVANNVLQVARHK